MTNRKGMAMKKMILLILMASFLTGNYCWADTYKGSLAVGSDSFQGGFNVIRDMADGFWNTGVSVLYNRKHDTEYKWADIGITVGGNMFKPGLSCEVGVKGLLGKAEDENFSGDVGGIAFTGRISYDFSQQMIVPGSFKMFSGIDYANDILSFLDTKNYFSFHVGFGIPIFEHATIMAIYSYYKMDMSPKTGDWTLEDDAFRAGLEIRF